MKITKSIVSGLAGILLSTPLSASPQNKSEEAPYSLMSKDECVSASQRYSGARIRFFDGFIFDGLVYDETARKVCVYNIKALKQDLDELRERYFKLSGRPVSPKEKITEGDFVVAYLVLVAPPQQFKHLRDLLAKGEKEDSLDYRLRASLLNSIARDAFKQLPLLTQLFTEVKGKVFDEKVLIPDVNNNNMLTAEDAATYKKDSKKSE